MASRSMSPRCPYSCSSTEKARAWHLSCTERQRPSPRCASSSSTASDASLQRRPTTSTGYPAGPEDPQPSYQDIDSAPLNKAVMSLFRRKMVQHIGSDSNLKGYDAIIDLTRKLNQQHATPAEVQNTTRYILKSLFPRWLPGAFKVMVVKPLPALSRRLNAWVTALTCQWLMGPCQVNDVELADGRELKSQGVKVERCRYLEQSGCASICLNSCKVPTQEFFRRDMGLDLCMTPNYEDFSCQFDFGKKPLPQEQDEAFTVPCFTQCPSKRPHKRPCYGIEPSALDS